MSVPYDTLSPIMTMPVDISEDELRILKRLAPLIRERKLASSSLDKVLVSLGGESLRASVEGHLAVAGIAVVASQRPAGESGGAPPQTRAAGNTGSEASPPQLVSLNQSVAAAHALLRADERRIKVDKVTLTAEQEVGLARLMRPQMPLSQELEPGARGGMATGSLEARAFDAFVLHNTRLVWSLAVRHVGQGLEDEDLAGYGMVGLMRAVEKFDASKGLKFSTYATWWIRQSITRALADYGRLVRLPVHFAEKVSKVRIAAARISENGLFPTTERIAAATGMEVAEILEVRARERGVVSLDTTIDEDGETALRELLDVEAPYNASVPASPESVTLLHERDRALDAALKGLPEREADIVRRRFGIAIDEPQTLEEIGALYGVTRERIRQLEKVAMSRLKHPASKRALVAFQYD